jgi:glycosyltransferase involved in cell wall biosynthesis
MFVQEKQSDNPNVFGPEGKWNKGLYSLRPTLDVLPRYLINKADKQITPGWVPGGPLQGVLTSNPDVVHLHWVNKGFFPIQSTPRLPGAIVWTLHDMWPFTGGCHHSMACDRYTTNCGCCPQLESNREIDLSRWIWRRKAHAWGQIELVIVTPSQWMATQAAKSALFNKRRIEVIHNGLDLKRFHPFDRSLVRQWLGVPKDKFLLLFSAIKGSKNQYKGFHYLEEILSRLDSRFSADDLELIVLGESQSSDVDKFHFPLHFMGQLHDEISLSLVYAAVDCFLAPSVIDNFPNTVMEAMACGTPCIGFRVGGIPEMIEHQENGFLAEAYDCEMFARGIQWVIEDQDRWGRLSQNARDEAVRMFDYNDQALKYLELYNEIIKVDR